MQGTTPVGRGVVGVPGLSNAQYGPSGSVLLYARNPRIVEPVEIFVAALQAIFMPLRPFEMIMSFTVQSTVLRDAGGPG